MRGLSPEHLVRLWENGVGRHPTDRALAILRAADPESEVDALPLGERDRRLLQVRERTFGREVDATVSCPRCGARVEWRSSTGDFARVDDPPDDGVVDLAAGRRRVRPLTSRDLAAAARCGTPDDARRLLAARCLEPTTNDDAIALVDLSADDLDVVAGALERVDPGAVCTLDIACPDCGEHWESELDVAQFVWTEIETAAVRLLRDVHAIARAYGWSERDILAMTPARRRAYLELVQ
jgi:hypothetical protein